MGKLSRTKGRAFEQSIARRLRAVFPLATIHRSSQADRAYDGDVVIEGTAPALVRRLWLELQDARNPTPLDKLAQAERDANPHAQWHIPAVVWHRLGARSIQVTLRLDALSALTQTAPTLAPFTGVPVTVDWEQFLDVLRALAPPVEAVA